MVCLVDRAGVQTLSAAPRRDLGATDMVGKLASEVNRRRRDCARNRAPRSVRLLPPPTETHTTRRVCIAAAVPRV